MNPIIKLAVLAFALLPQGLVADEQQEMIICQGSPDIFIRHLPSTGQSGNNSPVIFVHGSSFPSGLSIAFDLPGGSGMERLAGEGFDMWAFDFAGYGRSGRYPEMIDPAEDHPPLGRAKEAASQLSCVVDHVMVETGVRQISIIAHSAGTMVAGLYIGNNPEKVERLVLFGPVAERQGEEGSAEFPDIAWDLHTIEQQYNSFIRDVPANAGPVFSKQTMALWGQDYLDSDPTSANRIPRSVKTPTGSIRDVIAAWNGRLVYDPALIAAPTLILHGAWDSVTTDADAMWLYKALKNTRSRHLVRLPEGTHRMHLEKNRSSLYRAVANFLRGEKP